MKTIVVAFHVLKQQRSWTSLACIVASTNKLDMFFRIADGEAHRLIPAIGHRHKMRIEGGAQVRDQVRQRIAEVFVFSSPKTMPSHYHPAAKQTIVRIERSKRAAFLGREKIFDERATLIIKAARNIFPIQPIYLFYDSRRCGRLNRRFHAQASRSRRARLRSTPQRYPDNVPSERTTRWQGTSTARGLAAQALATARIALGRPSLRAISA